MRPDAILALISDLYVRILGLQQENADLKAKLAGVTAEEPSP